MAAGDRVTYVAAIRLREEPQAAADSPRPSSIATATRYASLVASGIAMVGILASCRRVPDRERAPASSVSSAVPAPPTASSSAAPSAAASSHAALLPYRLVARLVAPTSRLEDGFGVSMAVDEHTLAVAAPRRKDAIGRGVVYLYHHDGSTWTPEGVVRNPKNDADSGDAVALVRGRLFVSRSDPYRTELPAWFRREDGRWVADGYEPAPPGATPGFGALIAVSGDDVVVGTRGQYGFPGKYYGYRATPEGLRPAWSGQCFRDCDTNYSPASLAAHGTLTVGLATLGIGSNVALLRDGKVEAQLDWPRFAHVAVHGETVVLSDEGGTHFVEKRDGKWVVVRRLAPGGSVAADGEMFVSSVGEVFGRKDGEWEVVGRLEGLERGRGGVAVGGGWVVVGRAEGVFVFSRG